MRREPHDHLVVDPAKNALHKSHVVEGSVEDPEAVYLIPVELLRLAPELLDPNREAVRPSSHSPYRFYRYLLAAHKLGHDLCPMNPGIVGSECNLHIFPHLRPYLLKGLADVLGVELVLAKVVVHDASGGRHHGEHHHRLMGAPARGLSEWLPALRPVPLHVCVDGEEGLIALEKLVAILEQGMEPLLKAMNSLHLLVIARQFSRPEPAGHPLESDSRLLVKAPEPSHGDLLPILLVEEVPARIERQPDLFTQGLRCRCPILLLLRELQPFLAPAFAPFGVP